MTDADIFQLIQDVSEEIERKEVLAAFAEAGLDTSPTVAWIDSIIAGLPS